LKIPLGRLEEDLWAWSAEKHGMYTIKSAYKLLASHYRYTELAKSKVLNSSCAENNPIWRKLWKLKVLPKIKSFWWRVINNYMPVQANLVKRHMKVQTICQDCQAEEETVHHVLVNCIFVRVFWISFRNMFGIKLPNLHPATWSQDLLDKFFCPQEHQNAILCGMWAIWMARNKRIHGENKGNMPERQ
jgi:hypothetical protein